jgi:hypothetical protein
LSHFIQYFLGLTCCCVALVPSEKKDPSSEFDNLSVNSLLIIAFASIGKSMSAASYNSAYVYSAQSYPTSIRNTMVLFISSLGRLGSIIAPQVNYLKIIWSKLPYLLFGSSSLLACLLVYFLPNPARAN